jgi:hypothetical protein
MIKMTIHNGEEVQQEDWKYEKDEDPGSIDNLRCLRFVAVWM